MKKTYIEPENTVVKLNLEKMLANSPTDPQRSFNPETPAAVGDGDILEEMDARESLNTWDEW